MSVVITLEFQGELAKFRQALTDHGDQFAKMAEERGDITTESFTAQLSGLAPDQHLVRLIIADAGRSAAQAGTGRPRRGRLPW